MGQAGWTRASTQVRCRSLDVRNRSVVLSCRVENHWHFKLVLEMYVVMEEKIQQISSLKFRIYNMLNMSSCVGYLFKCILMPNEMHIMVFALLYCPKLLLWRD